MKTFSAIVLSVLVFFTGMANSALAEDYYYWPEFGTQASHNDWGAKAVYAPEAQLLGATGNGVKVAILDDGLSETSSNLFSKVIAYKDFLPGFNKRAEHGSYVASTLAADYNAEVGIRGVAPGVSLIIARVCQRGGCYWDAMHKAFAWAVTQGAQVISMSFSGNHDPEMHAAILNATQKGIVVVGALGNFGCGPYGYWGLNHLCNTMVTSTEGTQVAYPIAGAIGVGASDQRNGRYATVNWSSSFGPNLDILAPGTDTSGYDHFGPSNGFGGTSSATPTVAGIAALILEANPALRSDQVQAIIQSSATAAYEEKFKVWDSCTKDPDTNNWSCDQLIDSTLPQQYFTGAGVANAEAAVKLARKSSQHKLLGPVNLSQENLQLTITWDGGPADLYINSKLIGRDISSGYQYQGFASQSVAVQIKRNNLESLPALAVMKLHMDLVKPEITQPFIDSDHQLRFSVSNLTGSLDSIWTTWTWAGNGYAELAGLYEFDDGETVACRGTRYEPAQPAFTCRYQPGRQNFNGRFRVIGKYSELSEYSDAVTPFNPGYPELIDLTTNYSDSGLPTFNWSQVAGANSYRFRYEVEFNTYCTANTSFTVPQALSQPAGFEVTAYASDDCSGQGISHSENITWTAVPAKPAKPTGITITNASYEEVDFEIANRDPNASYRLYRSDGMMGRIMPGQPIRIGMGANEEVNGVVFTYRFIQINSSIWGESWSDPSDPIQVSLSPMAPPSARCYQVRAITKVRCMVNPVRDSQKTRIEYLDSDYTVLDYVEISGDEQITNNPLFKAATYVRVAGTRGTEKSKYSWYRRGESRVVTIGTSKRVWAPDLPR